MTNRVEKAINIFLDAINNGTLAKGTCTACAVGNLVANGLNHKIELTEIGLSKNSMWSKVFYTNSFGKQLYRPEELLGLVKKNIDATDFSVQELMEIEHVFEINTKINWEKYSNYSKNEIKQDQIKGLEAVIKVILEFEEDKETVINEVFTSKVLIEG